LSQECLVFSKNYYIFGKLEESGKGVEEQKRFRQGDLGVLFVVCKSGKDETCVRVISAEDLLKQTHLNRENVLKLLFKNPF
jgi:hypothetical protein